MEKSNVVIYLLLGIALIMAIYTAYTLIKDDKDGQPAPDREASSSFRAITTGDTGPGDVSIELAPKAAIDGMLEVAVSVDTHSVDLGQFDLKGMTSLKYNGKSINPSSAPQLSGHHSSGTLFFEVGGDIRQFTIIITGIPKTEKRVFEWR
ncbi:hypothetical protein HYT92_01920 [Candidatus Pacearchaeota archaeon]|nr:hypothetical protein [Candidatus Pacearchaeota archaeon]